MRIDWLHLHSFKNLIDFEIDFDESKWETVLIGENGTGKSNLIEALVIIFRDLHLIDTGKRPELKYEIHYICNGDRVEVKSNPKEGARYSFRVNTENTYLSEFSSNTKKWLPKHVFAYYSGPNRRIESLFYEHTSQFNEQIRDRESEYIRPLFLCRNVHGQFILPALCAMNEGPPDWLTEYLGVSGIDSVLFSLYDPGWNKGDGDKRFWGTEGEAADFLSDLWSHSLPAVRTKAKDQVTFDSTRTLEHLYLFVPNQSQLIELGTHYSSASELFKLIESVNVIGVLKEVRTIVSVEHSDGSVTDRQLSEGEKQLLTVLGMLHFASDEESLFLLDEPDTHLNPLWKIRYLSEIVRRVIDPEKKKSHFILTTHDPVTISGLDGSQVQIFKRSETVEANRAESSPRGKGIGGVLTEMFGLQTSLDLETQKKLDTRNELLAVENKTDQQEQLLREKTRELESLGFSTTFRDALYQRFVQALGKHDKYVPPSETSAASKKEQRKIAGDVLKDILDSSQ